MKTLTTIGLSLIMSITAFAQGPITPGTLPFRSGNTIIDSAGNLVVIDLGRSATGVTVTGLRHSFYPPQTQITIQRPGTTSNTQTVTYAAAIQVIGAGPSAIYAIATVDTVSGTTLTSTETLIAIKPGQSLPTAITGFPSQALTPGTHVKGDSSDYLVLITETAATSTTSATRNASVVHFNGSSFDVISSGTLP